MAILPKVVILGALSTACLLTYALSLGQPTAPELPADAITYLSHRATCAALSGEDAEPWIEHGCYTLGKEELATRNRYSANQRVLNALNTPLPRTIRPDRMQSDRNESARNGGVWSSSMLDWHNFKAEDAPAAVAVLNNEIVMTAPPN